MKIIDDRREQRLGLYSYWYLWGLRDWFPVVLLVGVSVGIYVFMLLMAEADLSDPLSYLAEKWYGLLMVGLWLVFPATAITYAVCIGLGLLRDWDYLELDELAGRVRARQRGWLPYRAQAVDRSLEEIDAIGLLATPVAGNAAQSLKINITWADRSVPPLEMKCQVSHVDRREEALDLLYRLGRASGCRWYFAGSEVRSTAAQVMRKQHSELPLEPLPELHDTADYSANRTSSGLAAPPPTVAPFDSISFQRAFTAWRLEAWQPGELVHLVLPQASREQYLWSIGTGAVIGGGVGWYAFHALWPGWKGHFLCAGGGALVGAGISLFGCLYAYARRELLLDWRTRQINLVYGSRTQTLPLGDVQRLLLRGLTKQEKRGSKSNRRTQTCYACDLVLVMPNNKHYPVLQTPHWSVTPEQPINALAPFTASLSEALAVDWEWIEFR